MLESSSMIKFFLHTKLIIFLF
jgi:hypothetical protein